MPVFEILALYTFNIYVIVLAKSHKRGQKVVCKKKNLTNIFSLFFCSKLKWYLFSPVFWKNLN